MTAPPTRLLKDTRRGPYCHDRNRPWKRRCELLRTSQNPHFAAGGMSRSCMTNVRYLYWPQNAFKRGTSPAKRPTQSGPARGMITLAHSAESASRVTRWNTKCGTPSIGFSASTFDVMASGSSPHRATRNEWATHPFDCCLPPWKVTATTSCWLRRESSRREQHAHISRNRTRANVTSCADVHRRDITVRL